MKQQLIIVCTFITLVIGGGILMVFNDSQKENLTLESYETPEDKKDTEPVQEQTIETIVVDVKGAVKSPGVYEVQSTLRVHHVINLAGGLTEEADEAGINLSQKLQDEMVIFVPTIGEASETVTTHATEKISINRADLTQLQTLPGIGEAKAQAIITYREQSGPFKTIEDITNVPGIGEKTLEKFKDLIVP